MPEAPPPVRIANQSSVNSVADAVPTAVAMVTTSQEPLPVQVNEERGRGVDSEYVCMDMPSEEEAELGEQGGEELDISFDSQFPDLISDLITEESSPAVAPPPASSTPRLAVFPTGVRYVVPPQPSPSSSFLPFPHPLPSATRLASITDFSPEWSYPEVTDQFGSEPAAGNCSECLFSAGGGEGSDHRAVERDVGSLLVRLRPERRPCITHPTWSSALLLPRYRPVRTQLPAEPVL